MRNKYKAIGLLIMDLRNGRFLLEEGFAAELKKEFRDITLQLGAAWMNKVEGIGYYLDFHRGEAERLRAFVDFEEGKPNVTLRLLMHEELTEQMRRLDIMIADKSVSVDWMLKGILDDMDKPEEKPEVLMKDHPIVRKIFILLCRYRMQDEELGNHLAKVMKGKFYPKRDVVFERGSTDGDAIYVSDGYLVCIGFDELGDWFLLGIYGKDTIIASLSFMGQQPSNLEWIALPGSYLQRVSHDDMEYIFKKFPKTEKLARVIMADIWEKELMRKIGLRRKSKEVVLDFYTRFPDFLKNSDLLLDEEIASYLLLAVDTFRKARSRLSLKG